MDEDASDASRGSDRERSRYSAQERVLTHSSGPCAPVFVRCNLRLRDRESNRPARSGRDRWPPPRFPRHHSGLGTTQASEYVACTWTNASSACLPFRSVRLGATKPKPQVTGPFRPSWIIDQDAQTTRSSRICPAAGTSSSRSGADRSAEHRSRPEAAPTQQASWSRHVATGWNKPFEPSDEGRYVEADPAGIRRLELKASMGEHGDRSPSHPRRAITSHPRAQDS